MLLETRVSGATGAALPSVKEEKLTSKFSRTQRRELKRLSL